MKFPVRAIAMAAVVCCGAGAHAQGTTPMAAKDLAQAFRRDRAAAIGTYSGKPVLLKGTIGRINPNQFGTTTMILDGQYIGEGLGVWLRAGQDAKTLAVGQVVTLRCEVQKNNDVIQDCVFVY
jgi:hypothetical protein